ncbi:MAG: glycosyl hydrolase family 28-related protein [Armatimonadota bacterium]
MVLTKWFGIGLFTMVLASTAFAAPKAVVKPAALPIDGVFNVRLFGAKGDGVTDDTEAFRKALSAAAPIGGCVRVPPVSANKGYVLTNVLTIPPGVSLVGSLAGFSTNQVCYQTQVVGSRIFARPRIDQYAGKQKQPLFLLQAGVTVKGLVIMYDQQPFPSDEEFQDKNSKFYYPSFEAAQRGYIKDHVKPYGPTFYTESANVVIEDIACDRYNDFYFQVEGGKCIADRIYLNGYGRGFVMGRCFDVNRIMHVHGVPNVNYINPGKMGDKTYSWIFGIITTSPNNVGIQLAQADGYTLDDVTFFGIHTGIQIGVSKQYPLVDPVRMTTSYYDLEEGKGYGVWANAPYLGNGAWGDISALKVDQCVIGVHFVWPTHLSNRISNAWISTAVQDGVKFPTVASSKPGAVARQGAFVVEPTYGIKSNVGIRPTFMANGVFVASYNDSPRFGPAAANAADAGGRAFLIGGDINIDITGFLMNDPYREDMLWARSDTAQQVSFKIRGFTVTGNPQPDVMLTQETMK